MAITAVASFLVVGHQPAANAESQSVPVDFVNPHECTLELVELQGRVHVVTQVTENTDGTFHVMAHTNTQGVDGYGFPSGDRYVFVEGTHAQTTESAPANSINTTFHHVEYIHMGESLGYESPGLDDLHVKLRVVVVLTNGVPTTHVFQDSRECK
ncbi:MAG TPA: hypothetical protein VG318_01950 [Actinomycetota bacterium]|nr:hypothetical protein [Actinomycetota bacterium]